MLHHRLQVSTKIKFSVAVFKVQICLKENFCKSFSILHMSHSINECIYNRINSVKFIVKNHMPISTDHEAKKRTTIKIRLD